MVAFRRICKLACIGVGVVFAVVGVLLLVAVIRAATLEDLDYQESKIAVGSIDTLPQWYLDGLPQVMSKAISIATVARGKGDVDTEQILRFHQFLEDSFANVYNSTFITLEKVNKYSLLYTIQGNDRNLQPYLLLSHIDVVPVVEDKWKHDPFGGEIINDPTTGEDYIWGRGAIDDKLGVMGIMMALNYLAMTDFQPSRTFYVAFGHDEEVSGLDGAVEIAKVLERRGVTEVEFILDEGMPILQDVIQGMPIPVASIGVTEKGYMTIEIETEGEGGHSSMPPFNSAVSRLATAITQLETTPQPSMFGRGPELDMFTYIAPKASWPHKLVFANLWLFKPILEMVLSSKRDSNAIIRTTTSTTIVDAGIKENVVPVSARAVVNHRIHPAQTIESVLDHDRAIINDPSVKIKVLQAEKKAPVSPYGPHVGPWRLITAAVHHHFPDVVTAPSMVVGYTDTTRYLHLSKHVYRFIPMLVTSELLATYHGHNERCSTRAVQDATAFYHHLILSADRLTPGLYTPPGHRSGEL